MIRCIRRSLQWIGAATALLLLPLTVQADDIEPEPYHEEAVVETEPEREVAAEEEAKTEITPAAVSDRPSVGAKIFDVAILRTSGFVATILGAVFFVPAAMLATGAFFVPSTIMFFESGDRARAKENLDAAWEHFVVVPAEDTFKRPLGEF
jgi:hypothetical protein